MKLHRRIKITKTHYPEVLDLISAFILLNSVRKFQTNKGCHEYMTYDQFHREPLFETL